jgi:hypothetical protein
MARQKRTAQELIQEQEARLGKLKEKAALEEAKQSPELAPLLEALESEQAAYNEAQRGLSTSPQSFQSRLTKHHAWIREIEAAIILAEVVLDQSSTNKHILTDAIADLSQKLSQNEPISVEVMEVLATINEDESLIQARDAYALAHSERKSLTNSNKKETSQ